MAGVFSSSSFSNNPIERAKQLRLDAGLPLLDLTESNPTAAGFLFPEALLIDAAKDYFRTRRYTPEARGLLAAREAISEFYRLRTPSIIIQPQQIFITASTSESYRLLFSLLAEPGDNFLAPQVNYPLFEIFAADCRLALREFLLEEKDGWKINEHTLAKAVDQKTRGTLFVSPHNPTGAVQTQTLDAVSELKLPIVADEVFANFPFRLDSIPALGSLYPNQPVFHLNGISKMFALPDLKLGWIALNASAYEQFGERLELLNDSYLSANQFSQFLLPRLFLTTDTFCEEFRAEIKSSIADAIGILRNLPFVEIAEPDGGTFLFPAIRTTLEEEDLVLKLIAEGLYTHPSYFYGDLSRKHLLISCVGKSSEIVGSVNLLCAALRKHCG